MYNIIIDVYNLTCKWNTWHNRCEPLTMRRVFPDCHTKLKRQHTKTDFFYLGLSLQVVQCDRERGGLYSQLSSYPHQLSEHKEQKSYCNLIEEWFITKTFIIIIIISATSVLGSSLTFIVSSFFEPSFSNTVLAFIKGGIFDLKSKCSHKQI